MAAGFRVLRIKPNAIDDNDPRITPPPETEVLIVNDPGLVGVRFALVFTGAGIPVFTATVSVFARNSADNTWFLAGTQTLVPHRRTVVQCDMSTHDLWIGLTQITGGDPITVLAETVRGC